MSTLIIDRLPPYGNLAADTDLYAHTTDACPVTASGGPTEICHGCGAIKGLYDGARYLRCGDARFCAACAATLSDERIADIVRAIALQGVPFS